jgi:hypothetical protein
VKLISRWCRLAGLSLGLLSSLLASAQASPDQQWRFEGVERVAVIPDVHGAYDALTELLIATGLVDSQLHWSGGSTHVVSLGDLLDRGADSRKVMDLLMRLQDEAAQQGGAVHVVAGNHETMNLLGDLRYVAPREYAAMGDLEPPGVRELAYNAFLEQRSEAAALSFLGGRVESAAASAQNRRAFEEIYPEGYFGHRSAFSPQGVYGRWLLSLPAIIVINDTAFVHGGLPEVAAGLPLDELNRRYQADLQRFFELWEMLFAAGVLDRTDIQTNLQQARRALRVADPSTCPRPQRAECVRERGRASDRERSPGEDVLKALRELLEIVESPLFGPSGPQWYRGSVRCRAILEQPLLQAALDNLGAARVVVGHTPTTDRRVHVNMDGALVMLDTGMLVEHYQGRPALLLMEGDKLAVQYLNPTELTAPLGEGGNGYYPLDAQQIEAALATGDIVEVDKGWFADSWNITLSYQGVELAARFFPADDTGSQLRELAAYRLDKLLGFELVPATVPRIVDGREGVMQLFYPDFMTESERQRQGRDPGAECPLEEQFQLLEVFDLLVAKEDRSETSFGYPRPLWNLQAGGYSDAFGRGHVLPGAAGEVRRQLPRSVRNALLGLDRATLATALGEQLDDEQITALLARRNTLFSIVQFPAASYGQSEQAATGDRPQ